jgi:hypothetical protein
MRGIGCSACNACKVGLTLLPAAESSGTDVLLLSA